MTIARRAVDPAGWNELLQRLCAILALLVGLLLASPAASLDPTRSIGQLKHTGWTDKDGAPETVNAFAQTPDRYLWIGAADGLYRFDGMQFQRFLPVNGQGLMADNVNSLLATSNGDLWIGHEEGGLSVMREGRLTHFPDASPTRGVTSLVEDQDHTLWASVAGPAGVLRFDGARWRPLDAGWGYPGGAVSGLLVTRDGALWVASQNTIHVLRRGARRFEATGVRFDSFVRMVEAPDGRIWIGQGVKGVVAISPNRLAGHPAAAGWRLPPPDSRIHARRMIIDRDGGLWSTSFTEGVFRIPSPGKASPGAPAAVETYRAKDGLTDDITAPIFEGREGDVWVGSYRGVDRFRTANVVADTTIPTNAFFGYRAVRADARNLYIGDNDTLFRIGDDGVPRILRRFDHSPMTALCADGKGAVWIGLSRQFLKMSGGRFSIVPLPNPASETVLNCAVDAEGALWISVQDQGLFKSQGRGWTKVVVRADLANAAPWMVADRVGRLWLNPVYDVGRTLLLVDGASVRSFSGAEGPDIGHIGIIYPRDRDVLFGGDGGLARFDGRRFQTFKAQEGGPLRRISGIAETAGGVLWLNTARGVVRTLDADLQASLDHPGQRLPYRLLDFQDGLPGAALQDASTPTAIDGPDGRLWLLTTQGVAWLDPARLATNHLPPLASITAVAAEGKAYPPASSIALPAGTQNLQIDYAGLSLSIPERVRYRYRMSGVDAGWVDAGPRQQAFYTKLGPGDYRFRVLAANNDGVWTPVGATVDISVAPTFVQTPLFWALCVLGVLGLGWLLYSLRLRQMTERIRGRLEERLFERERIARELHDTLLQGVQGLILRFQAVAEQIPADQPARRLIETVLDRADSVMTEGRDRVRNLRVGHESGDVSEAFVAAAARAAFDSSTSFRLVTEGAARALHPIVREEVVRIGEEAIQNAFQHARAKAIDVVVTYHRRGLRLSVQDDGVGLDATVVSEGGREGHYGLVGMRERARKIRAEFRLLSRAGGGAQIDLTVPASVAYAGNGARRWFARRPSSRPEADL